MTLENTRPQKIIQHYEYWYNNNNNNIGIIITIPQKSLKTLERKGNNDHSSI